jgi:hypothetical protein
MLRDALTSLRPTPDCRTVLVSSGKERNDVAESHFNYDKLERAGKFLAGTFSVIFVDIVRFTAFGDNKALRKGVRALQNAVVDVFENLKWDEILAVDNDAVMLPTGDGYGIAFESWISDIEVLRYAVELSDTLRSEGYPIRMGINKGTCFVYKDLNEHLNLVGWGIIDAERAMSCGGRSHILCTGEFAKQALDMKADPNFHDIGTFVVKDRKLHLFNYYSDAFGNPEQPKAKRATPKAKPKPKKTGTRKANRRVKK